LLVLAGLGLLLVTLFELGNVQRPGASPEAAIRQVLDEQATAWNRGDLDAFMNGYWVSHELSFFSGKDRKQGWQETKDRYRARYQGEGREMGQLTFSDLEIDVLSADTAWVRGRWQVVTSKETLDGLFTLVFKKPPEGWRIVHDHTSG
jgi:beta-aspartyl-peptidase (threonine type)